MFPPGFFLAVAFHHHQTSSLSLHPTCSGFLIVLIAFSWPLSSWPESLPTCEAWVGSHILWHLDGLSHIVYLNLKNLSDFSEGDKYCPHRDVTYVLFQWHKTCFSSTACLLYICHCLTRDFNDYWRRGSDIFSNYKLVQNPATHHSPY